MKLQIKDSGSWRNLVGFNQEQQNDVMHHASFLLKALNQPRTVMRITMAENVLAYCEAPNYQWRADRPPA